MFKRQQKLAQDRLNSPSSIMEQLGVIARKVWSPKDGLFTVEQAFEIAFDENTAEKFIKLFSDNSKSNKDLLLKEYGLEPYKLSKDYKFWPFHLESKTPILDKAKEGDANIINIAIDLRQKALFNEISTHISTRKTISETVLTNLFEKYINSEFEFSYGGKVFDGKGQYVKQDCFSEQEKYKLRQDFYGKLGAEKFFDAKSK